MSVAPIHGPVQNFFSMQPGAHILYHPHYSILVGYLA